MKRELLHPVWSFWVGALLTVPAFYFLLASLLKYVLGMPLLFDALQPSFERWGSAEPLGWNINAIMIFGPLIAIGLNVFAVVHADFRKESDYLQVHIRFFRNWWNWAIVLLNAFVLGSFFLYALAENCNCS
jgi:hypothetical protein